MKSLIENPDIGLEEKLKKIWNGNNFSLDIPIIDLQHVWLMWLMLQLESVIEIHNQELYQEKVKFINSEIFDYSVEHFIVEETMMDYFQYQGEVEQTHQHNEFKTIISSLIADGKDSKSILNKLKFLQSWTYGHILVTDREYKKFFVKNNIDVRAFFDEVIKKQRIINITRVQASLYNRITGLDNNVDVMINKDTLQSVQKIWNTYSLNLGIYEIDVQHLWLIKIIVELELGSKIDNNRLRDDIFFKASQEILRYIREHFSAEEMILKRFNFTENTKHFKQHRNFIDIFNNRLQQKKDGFYIAHYGLVSDMKEWLISHVAIEDRMFSIYFKDKQDELKRYIEQLRQDDLLRINKQHSTFYQQVTQGNLN